MKGKHIYTYRVQKQRILRVMTKACWGQLDQEPCQLGAGFVPLVGERHARREHKLLDMAHKAGPNILSQKRYCLRLSRMIKSAKLANFESAWVIRLLPRFLCNRAELKTLKISYETKSKTAAVYNMPIILLKV